MCEFKREDRIIEYRLEKNDIDKTVSDYLLEHCYPKSCISQLRKKEGLIQVDGKNVHTNYRISEKGILKITIREYSKPTDIEPENIPLDIIFEDEDILVINKPAGMSIHQSVNNYNNTLSNAVAFYMNAKGEEMVFRCINRLDRDTSGITIIAKNYLAAGILASDMKNRLIHREYTALVDGTDMSDEGTIDLPIGRARDSVIKRCIDEENGERAVTHYKVIERYKDKNISKVRLNLETGRTHQIRVHMEAIGHPLVGDFLYSADDKRLSRQALHAGRIRFIHPVTRNEMKFEVYLPGDLLKLVKGI